MKKKLVLALAATLLLSFTACGQTGAEYAEAILDDSVIEEEVIETETETEEESEAPVETETEDARAAYYEPCDPDVEAAVYEQLQGEWEYTDNGVTYDLTFDGYNFNVVASAGGASMENSGTYEILAGTVLVTYETGLQAHLDYTWDGTNFAIYPLVGEE